MNSRQSFTEWFENGGFILFIVVGALLILTLVLSIYSVSAGNVGVITRFGAVNRTVNPGVGWKIPFVERKINMSVRTQKIEAESAAASSNLQEVYAIVSVNYHLDGQFATDVFQSIGRDYEEIVVAPAIQQSFKSTTAQYTAEEIITRRAEISELAMQGLQEALEPYHIVVERFNLSNVDFSEQYNESIEQKQVQEQKVEIARLKKEEAIINAETVQIEAQAQADAQETLNNTDRKSVV